MDAQKPAIHSSDVYKDETYEKNRIKRNMNICSSSFSIGKQKKTHFRYIFRCSTRDGAPRASIALMPQRRFIETDKFTRSSLDSYSMRTYLNDDAYAHHCVESIDSTECVYEKRDFVAVACWCGREKETRAV